MQTILGAGGVIGNELAKVLPQYTSKIRLVSRNSKKVNPGDELVSADLNDSEQVLSAVKGSKVVYLTVGLPYSLKVWQEQWPVVMKNVIEACKAHGSKLVFFDNMYMYGKQKGWITEETQNNPVSKKGKIRAEIANHLLKETEKGNLKALITRSADFYGPGAKNTFIKMMIFDKFKAGKAANWLVNDKVKHSLTFTPDAATATAVLGNTDDAYNQIWHLPTHKDALTGKEFIELSAQIFGVQPKYSVLKKWMLQMVGFFNPMVKETVEMLYQYEDDYLFDSNKFESKFFKATPYSEGIKQTAKTDYNR